MATSEKSYFNLHPTFIGYLRHIRPVKPKNGEAFLACGINALVGSADNVSYVRFDTRVVGETAQHLVNRCKEAVDAKRKVLIGFKLGDLLIDHFTYTKGERAGQQGTALKARLLYIGWIKIDGKEAYRDESKANQDESDDVQSDVSEQLAA